MSHQSNTTGLQSSPNTYEKIITVSDKDIIGSRRKELNKLTDGNAYHPEKSQTGDYIDIFNIYGNMYVGKIMAIYDPTKVCVGISSKLGKMGQFLTDIVKDNNALAGINAGGFIDDNGHGNGGTAAGLIISSGVQYSEKAGGYKSIIGFDSYHRLIIGQFDDMESLGLRDAVEFSPLLVVNGEKVIEGTAGWGVHPRTAIGQREDGTVIMCVIDGRRPGYSIGCTVGELADIMLSFGCINAANLDGGASTCMVYNGKVVNRTSNYELGRYLPCAFIVK
jgi:exopolysaccharide biosynthesis protein